MARCSRARSAWSCWWPPYDGGTPATPSARSARTSRARRSCPPRSWPGSRRPGACGPRSATASATPRRWLGASLAVTLAAALVLLTAKGLEASDPPWVWDHERRVRVLADDLGRRLAPGDTVQVLDITDGGLHALLRLRVRQPTRFLIDVFFFHEAERPVVRAIRAEFVAALEAAPPPFIVLMRGWPSRDYDRIKHFPALADLLARRYDVAVTREGYRLYAKRAGG